MVFEKGNKLVGCVNHALNQLKSDGTLQQIQEKWLAKVGGAPILH
jgi:polar amino acid transport system substrate-binding protein